jgi:hypothetical protein
MKPSQRYNLNRLAEKLVTPERFSPPFAFPERKVVEAVKVLLQYVNDNDPRRTSAV